MMMVVVVMIMVMIIMIIIIILIIIVGLKVCSRNVGYIVSAKALSFRMLLDDCELRNGRFGGVYVYTLCIW